MWGRAPDVGGERAGCGGGAPGGEERAEVGVGPGCGEWRELTVGGSWRSWRWRVYRALSLPVPAEACLLAQ